MYLAPPIYLVMRDKDLGWLEPIFLSLEDAKAAAKAAGLDPGQAVHAYPDKLGRFPSPMHLGWLAEMLKRGFIVPKSALKDGGWYVGECRNTNLAQWDAKRNVFVHWRKKFDRVFTETIHHPEDDDGFDLFWPAARAFPDPKTEDLRGQG